MGLGTVVGVDPASRKIASVVSQPSTNFLATHEVPQDVSRPKACHEMWQYMSRFFDLMREQHEEIAVYVEEPVIGRNRRAGILQAQVHGVILASALESGITSVYSISNTAWKKETVGSGNADKDACLAWLEREHPRLAESCAGDIDLIDAACIAAYGRRVQDRAGRFAGRVPSSG